jgi:hypothetical protein
MDSTPDAELSVPDDVWVALAAAACTVGLSLVLRFVFGQSVGFLVRLTPLWLYFAYLFVGKNADSGPLAEVRTWLVVIVATTLGVLGYAVL